MRKRSKYRPKPVMLNTMGYIKTGMKKLSDNTDANYALRIRNHSALYAIVKGFAKTQDVDEVISALNMTAALCSTSDIGKEYEAEIRAGLDALYALCQRSRFICTGPEIQALNLAMEIHDAQLDASTVNQVNEAVQFVRRAYRVGLARKFKEHTGVSP